VSLVFVPAGKTLHVALEPTPDADASIYLMKTCGDTSSCIAGSDVVGNGVIESFSYTNDQSFDTSLFLVFDGQGPLGYFAEIYVGD
jgi:hypothetical protein